MIPFVPLYSSPAKQPLDERWDNVRPARCAVSWRGAESASCRCIDEETHIQYLYRTRYGLQVSRLAFEPYYVQYVYVSSRMAVQSFGIVQDDDRDAQTS